MALWKNFPYSNVHELNLNWLLEKVREYVDKTDALEISYADLKAYVDNYFEDLDVQAEINNKLQDMYDSGELATLIALFLSTESLLTFNDKAALKAADNLADGVDALTLGNSVYNDSKSRLYKIRQLVSSDVVDDISIVALTNYPTLIAELVNDFEPDAFELHAIWQPTYFYVDGVDGNDLNDGTIEAPFKTLEHALNLANKGYPDLRIRIVNDGVYTISATDLSFNVLHLFNPNQNDVIVEFTTDSDIAIYLQHINVHDMTIRTQPNRQLYFDGTQSSFTNVVFEDMTRVRFYGGVGTLTNCTINSKVDFVWATGELQNTKFLNTDPAVSPVYVDNASTLRVRGSLEFTNLSAGGTAPAFDIRRSTCYFQNVVTDTGMTNKYSYLFGLQIAILLVPTTTAASYTRCAANLYQNQNSLIINGAVQLP